MTNPRRLVSLAYFTTSIKEGLEIADSTNTVVGVAYDFEQGMNLFKEAITSLADVFEENDNQETTAETGATGTVSREETKVEKAKHFGVFIATTLDKKNQPITTTVA